MTAGRGVIHSEMPEQEDGLLSGFQLWINLPAAHKMDPPAYQEFDRSRIPLERRDGGVEIRVIAGTTSAGTQGPVEQPLTEPVYLDVALPAGVAFEESLPAEHNAFVFGIEDETRIGDIVVKAETLGVLGPGDRVEVRAGETGARFLLIAGRPLNEPVARGGPFVMNTREEITQAFKDYSNGVLT